MILITETKQLDLSPLTVPLFEQLDRMEGNQNQIISNQQEILANQVSILQSIADHTSGITQIIANQDEGLANQNTIIQDIGSVGTSQSTLVNGQQTILSNLVSLAGVQNILLSGQSDLATSQASLATGQSTILQGIANLSVEHDQLSSEHQDLANGLEEVENNHDITPIGNNYTVTASNYQNDNVPENVKDNFDTRWSIEGAGEYLTFEFDSSKLVNSIQMSVFRGNERSQLFEVFGSMDGTVYDLVGDFASSGTTLSFENYTFDSILAKYIRIVFNGNSVTAWNSITGVRFNTPSVAEVTPKDPDIEVGDRVFFADHETGTISQWNNKGGHTADGAGSVSAGVVAENPHTGTYAIKMVGNAVTEKCALMYFQWDQNGPQNLNTDAIYSCWFRNGEKIDQYSNGFDNMFQWKARNSNGNSNPVITIGRGVRGGNGSGGDNYLQLRYTREWFPLGGASYDFTELEQVNLPINEYYKVTARYIQSETANGRVIVWVTIGGVTTRIYDVSGVVTRPTVDNNGFATSYMTWSCNLYYNKSIPAARVTYIDDAEIHLPKNPLSE